MTRYATVVPEKSVNQIEFETKLTRSEAIDMVIDEIRGDLETACATTSAAAQEARKNAERLREEITLRQIKTAKVTEVSESYRDQTSFFITLRVDREDMPKAFLAAIKAQEDAIKVYEEARNRLCEFNAQSSRMRIKVLRAALQASAEGQAFIKRIDELKLQLRSKMLTGEK